MISPVERTRQERICIQEHKFVHENIVIKEQAYDKWKLLTVSALKNTINAATGGIVILISNTAYNAIASVEMISPRIMIAHFQGKLHTSMISCYSPTNVSDDQ